MLLFLVSMLAIAMLGLLLTCPNRPHDVNLFVTHSGSPAKADGHLHRA